MSRDRRCAPRPARSSQALRSERRTAHRDSASASALPKSDLSHHRHGHLPDSILVVLILRFCRAARMDSAAANCTLAACPQRLIRLYGALSRTAARPQNLRGGVSSHHRRVLRVLTQAGQVTSGPRDNLMKSLIVTAALGSWTGVAADRCRRRSRVRRDGRRPGARQRRAGGAGASRDRPREPLSAASGRPWRHHRADADQARDRARRRLHRRCRRPARSQHQPHLGRANISPAPIAPRTATTPEPSLLCRRLLLRRKAAASGDGRAGRSRSRLARIQRQSAADVRRSAAQAEPAHAKPRGRRRAEGTETGAVFPCSRVDTAPH